MKYKVQQIITDTENIGTGMYDMVLKNSDGVYTSIEYNNDYIITTKLKRNTVVISSIKSLDEYETLMKFHLLTLRRRFTDVLLLDPYEMSSDNLEIIKFNPFHRYLGLKDPSMSDIEFYKEYIGLNPEYIMITINPISFPKDIIDYCNQNGIKIIGKNIFGQDDSFIYQWGMDYLISFASCHCDILAIPSKYGYEKFLYMNNLAKSLIDKEINEEDGAYTISKSINLMKPKPDKLISSYVKLGNNTINIGLPEDLSIDFDLIHTIGTKKNLEYIEPQEYFTPIEVEVNSFLSESIENSSIVSENEMQALGRYITIAVIRDNLSPIKYLNFEYEKLGNMFIIRVCHKFLWWIKDSFILSIRKLENEENSYRIFFEEQKKKSKKP